jgi:hypothetical protein
MFRFFSISIVVFTLFSSIHRLKAQVFLFDEETTKVFIRSSDFDHYGRIINNPFFKNRESYVDVFPSSDTWRWVKKGDSLWLNIDLEVGGASHVVFKNDIQAFTGMDKKDLGEYLVTQLRKQAQQSFGNYSESSVSVSAPQDSMHGILYNVTFSKEDNVTNDIGSILLSLIAERVDSLSADIFLLNIPQYGYKRDTVKLNTAQMNAFFGKEQWEFWLGYSDSQCILFCKNLVFNYAHLFYFDANNLKLNAEIPLELMAFIPDDNVQELFKVYRGKSNGLNIKINTN